MLDELDRDHEASEQAEMGASRRKIQLQETVEAEEIDEKKWTKLRGRPIVSEHLVKTSQNCFCELLINPRVSRRV